MYLRVRAETGRPFIAAAVFASLPGIAAWTGSTPLVALTLAFVTVAAATMPVAAIGAVILTLPWFFHPVALGPQRFAASELLLAVAVAATGINMLILAARREEGGSRWIGEQVAALARFRTIWVAGLLTFTGLLLAVYPYDAGHRAESLREWRWTLLEPLVFLGLFLFHRRSAVLPPLAATSFVAAGAVAAIWGFADLASSGGVSVAGVTRIDGPYPHPNALALFLARVVAFIIAWFTFDPVFRRRLAPALALVLPALVATWSRGAFAAVAVAAWVAVIPASPKLRLGALTGGIAGAALVLVAARERVLDLFGGGSGSLRLDIWSSAIEMIRDRPVIGYGPDQFLYAYAPRYIEPAAWAERFTAHAHNLLFDFWVRLGIIGATVVLLGIVVTFRRIIAVTRGRCCPSALRAAGTVALVAVIVHGMVDNAYFSHDLAMSAWLLAWFAFDLGSGEIAEGIDHRARHGNGWRWLHRLSPVRESPV